MTTTQDADETAGAGASGELTHGPCQECSEPISVDAAVCPHCGYDPAKTKYAGALMWIMIGAVLTIFVITAPIGLPMILIGIAVAIRRARQTPRPVDESALD